MNQLTSPENEHLAGYLELLTEERREYSPRAADARLGREPGMPDLGDELPAQTHPCEFYGWRYLCH